MNLVNGNLLVFCMAACSILLVAIVGWYGLRKQRQLITELKRQQDQITKLTSQLDFVKSGSIGFGQRLMKLEKRINNVVEKQDELGPVAQEALFKRQAERVLKGQMIQEDNEDGPTRSEARLMALVSTKSNPTSK